jgi:hypothetical protein
MRAISVRRAHVNLDLIAKEKRQSLADEVTMSNRHRPLAC